MTSRKVEHRDRRIAGLVRHNQGDEPGWPGRQSPDPTPDEQWVDTTPAEMARRALASFAQRFDWTLDDLRALTGTRPILAEGWGLRPDLIAPFLDSPRRMVVLVATAEFRDRQQRALPRARKLHYRVSDPECGQRNRLARDRLLAEDAAARAEEHGILTITVDGSLNAQQIADLVAHQFRPFLTVEPSTDLFS